MGTRPVSSERATPTCSDNMRLIFLILLAVAAVVSAYSGELQFGDKIDRDGKSFSHETFIESSPTNYAAPQKSHDHHSHEHYSHEHHKSHGHHKSHEGRDDSFEVIFVKKGSKGKGSYVEHHSHERDSYEKKKKKKKKVVMYIDDESSEYKQPKSVLQPVYLVPINSKSALGGGFGGSLGGGYVGSLGGGYGGSLGGGYGGYGGYGHNDKGKKEFGLKGFFKWIDDHKK